MTTTDHPAALGPGTRRAVATRLSALHAANFATIGIFMPFFPAWLAGRGFVETEIGLLLAIPMIVRTLTVSSVTSLGDGPLGPVRVVALLQLGSAAAYLSLFATTGLASVAFCLVAISAMGGGIMPLTDFLTTSQVRARPGLDYGRMRVWGSVSFLAMNILGGILVARWSAAIVPWLLAATAAASFVIASLSPRLLETRVQGAPTATPAAVQSFPPTIWLAIAAGAFINASHAMIYGFGTLHWRGLGISDQTIGVLWATSVVVEIAVLWFLGSWAARGMQAARLVVIGGLAAMLRFALMAAEPGLWGQFALQTLHAASFAMQWIGTIALISALAPERRRAAAQGAMTTVNAAVMALSTFASGWLYNMAGADAFLAMVPLAAVGVLFMLLLVRTARRHELERRMPVA